MMKTKKIRLSLIAIMMVIGSITRCFAVEVTISDYKITYSLSGSDATITRIEPATPGGGGAILKITDGPGGNLDGYNLTRFNVSSGSIFQYCPNLEEFDISGCTNLTSIGFTLFGLNTASSPTNVPNLESINFSGCTGLIVTLDNAHLGDAPVPWNLLGNSNKQKVPNLKSIDFSGCINIQTLGWSFFSAFPDYCTTPELESVNFSNSGIKEMMFFDLNTKLKFVDFSGCTDLEIIDDFIFDGTSSLESVDFSGCISLETIGEHAFGGNYNLKTFNFSGCTNLTLSEDLDAEIFFPHSLFFYAAGLQTVDFSGCTSMTSIPTRLFQDKKMLETVLLPEGLLDIKDYAFYNCVNIKTLEIPSSVTTIGRWAFTGMEGLEEFTMNASGDFMVDNDALYSNDMTRLVYYPGGKTGTNYQFPSSITTIDEGAFNGAKNLESFTASSASFMSDDGILYSTDGTILVRYPANKAGTFFETKETVTEVASSAFFGVKNLKEAVIGKSVETIGDELFYETELEKVTIKSTAITAIPDLAFRNSRNLKEVNLPHSITDLKTLSYTGLFSLESVILPAKVDKIELMAFLDCLKLDTITLLSSVIPELAKPAPGYRVQMGVFSELLPSPIFKDLATLESSIIKPVDPGFPGNFESYRVYFDFARDPANATLVVNKGISGAGTEGFLVSDWTGGPYLRIYFGANENTTNSQGQSYQNILDDPLYMASNQQEIYYVNDESILTLYHSRGVGNTLSLLRFCFVEYNYADNVDPLESTREMLLVDNGSKAEDLVVPNRPGYLHKGWKNVEQANDIGLDYFTDYMSTGVMTNANLRVDATNPSDWSFGTPLADFDLRLKAYYNPLVHLIIEGGDLSYYDLTSIIVGDNEVDSGSNYTFSIKSRHNGYDAVVERKNVGYMSELNGQYTLNNVVAPDTILVRLTRKPTTPTPDPEIPELPTPGITPESGINIPGLSSFCPSVDEFFLPFNLLISGKTIYYSLEFSESALLAGFENLTTYHLLPANSIIPIKVPRNVTGGSYSGFVLLQSDEVADLITRYEFNFDVEGDVVILQQPESISDLSLGDRFRLSVDATGNILSYQWYLNGVKIPGAISHVYESVLSELNDGIYHVVVYGVCDELKSDNVSVSCCFSVLMKWDDVMYVDNSDDKFVRYQWYKDGLSITNYGSSQYYTEEDGLLGTYFVRAYYVDGTYVESCSITFDERTPGASATLSPSLVTRGHLFNILLREIESEPSTTGLVDIYDMSGRIVYRDKLSVDINSIYADFTGGSYLVVVTLPSGKVEVKRLTIK